MIGHEGVTLAVVEALSARLPAKTAQMRTRLDLADVDLPDINTILGHEPDQVGIEYWPLVVVTSRGTKDARPMESDEDGFRRWLIRYDTRCTVWVRGDTYEQTTGVQQRLTLAVTEALLADLTLTDVVRLDDTSLTTSMSDVATTESGRTLAGARLDFALTVAETLERTPLPVVETVIDPDTSLLPPAGP